MFTFLQAMPYYFKEEKQAVKVRILPKFPGFIKNTGSGMFTGFAQLSFR
jgi:hypothetical protein